MEYLVYTKEEWEALPLQKRRELVYADQERKELETALNVIGALVNKNSTNNRYWKLIKAYIDTSQFGPKLIIK